MFHSEWRARIKQLREMGSRVGPRGLATRELLDTKLVIDSRYCLLDVPARGLNYRFAVAEWLWMMFGRSDVESLAQYNSVMRQFSDDGMFLTGAYGPHIGAQRDAILRLLREQPDTRQAVIEIPRPRRATKDEPCTLSFQYLIREGYLHCLVTMRSNDIWLGTPYDIYTFSQIQNCFAGVLGVPRGFLSLRAGSNHLYESHLVAAEGALREDPGTTLGSPDLPGLPPAWLEDVLVKRNAASVPASYQSPADQLDPWFPYAQVLLSPTSDQARDVLRRL